MNSIFPDLSEQKFSKIFMKFITTPDFSDFLQFMPDFKDLSVLEMNKIMVIISEQIRHNVLYEITGNYDYAAEPSRNRHIMFGGNTILLIMLHVILATYTFLGLPRKYGVFFVAVIAVYFISSILPQIGSFESASRVLQDDNGLFAAQVAGALSAVPYWIMWMWRNHQEDDAVRRRLALNTTVSDTERQLLRRRQSSYLSGSPPSSPRRPGPELPYRRAPNSYSRDR